jgi:hypothetical protein
VVSVLQWHPAVFSAVASLIAAAILVPLTLWSIRRGARDEPVMGNALTLVGGSFFFINAFVAVTVWQAETHHEEVIVKEFAAAANLAEDVIWYMNAGQMESVLGDRVLDGLTAYGQAVREEEMPRLTGLPGLPVAQGADRADSALQAVGIALDEHAVQASVSDESSLWTWWRGLSDNRAERIALRVTLPGALFTMMTVTALATLILLGVYPVGTDIKLRWIAGVASGVVVVTVLVSVVMLGYPGTKQPARQGPIEAMSAVIAGRP